MLLGLGCSKGHVEHRFDIAGTLFVFTTSQLPLASVQTRVLLCTCERHFPEIASARLHGCYGNALFDTGNSEAGLSKTCSMHICRGGQLI